jgi:hypothetical protein
MISPVEFSQNIQQVCMATEGSDFTGQNVTVSGWGSLWIDGLSVSLSNLVS